MRKTIVGKWSRKVTISFCMKYGVEYHDNDEEEQEEEEEDMF
jgi:hypothetical protein